MEHLLSYVAHSVIFSAVRTWFRELPLVVQVVVVVVAVAVLLLVGPVVGGLRSRVRGRVAYGKRDGRRRS
jgi:surface polysaccharide O-acyltransferase-like enzyme